MEKDKIELLYEFIDLISGYDYSECNDFNDFVNKIFYIIKSEKENAE